MKKIYHIDEPNHSYERSKDAANGWFYAVLYHPSNMDIKILHPKDKGKYWFDTREECLDARIARVERELKHEIEMKERKL